MVFSNSSLSKILSEWHQANPRPMPWKLTKDPYKIWISEIILQQTRVAQGTDYYLRFIDKFPTIKSLASAEIEEVLKIWEGLGYYSRARNLHFAAKSIIDNHNGVFPDKYEAILSLKGIGPYTAAAISSFAFDLPHAVLDGNVYRVIARIFGVKTPTDTGAGKKEITAHLESAFDNENPAAFNQAIMNFGATVCTPKKALCLYCPFQTQCVAYNTNMVYELPVKSKKTKVSKKFFNFLLIERNEEVLIEQRKDDGIWKLLFQYPLLEKEKATEKDVNEYLEQNYSLVTDSFEIVSKTKNIKHVLSHQLIQVKFWRINLKSEIEIQEGKTGWYRKDRLDELAFPVVIKNFNATL